MQSVTFADAKRTFTKDVLMRIDLLELANIIDDNYIETELLRLNKMYNLSLNLSLWEYFIDEMKPANNQQIDLFA